LREDGVIAAGACGKGVRVTDYGYVRVKVRVRNVYV